MKNNLLFSLSIPLLLPLLATAETNQIDRVETKKEKPWLVAPLVVANPSFGNGLGAVYRELVTKRTGWWLSAWVGLPANGRVFCCGPQGP